MFASSRNINSQFLRHSTARGSSTGLVPVGLTKVNACKSILFTEGTAEVEISQFCQIGKDWDQNADRMSKNDENLPYLH